VNNISWKTLNLAIFTVLIKYANIKHQQILLCNVFLKKCVVSYEA